jgi:hypothetical protein
LYDIKAAEWGGVYPGSMADIHLGKWNDNGQSKNIDVLTQEKIAKQPIIFEADPLITEEAEDEYEASLKEMEP